MTQIMKTHIRQTCQLQKLLKLISHLRGIKKATRIVTEHNSTLLPFLANPSARLFLIFLMLPKRLYSDIRQHDLTPACSGFRLTLNVTMPANVTHCTTDIDHTLFQIYIIPM